MDKAALQQKEAFLANALKTLEGEVRKLSNNNSMGFIKSFQNIEALPGARASVSLNPDNRRLNRYSNIVAYDHSRVKVKPTKANGNNDYINGNFLKGADGKATYIATQAPVPDAFISFWQMMWEQNVETIVMVTNEVEGGKLKCHRYWPDKNETVITAGEFKVQFSFQEVFPTHVKRMFALVRGREFRDIIQYAFTAWPDHGVPSTTQELLDFRNEVRKAWKPSKGKLAVHCSAGVGRTGTFIALDRFLEGIHANKFVSLIDIVTNMREDRNFMVQAQIQFVYLFHIALDGIHEILMEVQKELRRIVMSETERQEDLFREIQAEVNEAEQLLDEQIEDGETELEEKYKAEPQAFPAPLPPRPAEPVAVKAAKLIAHASHNDGQKYTDDLDRAKRVPAFQRATSLMEVGGPESQFWRTRRNIPLSIKDKGYMVDRAKDIGDRLEALDSEVKDAWKKRYETARLRWEEVMDEGGEVYDINQGMTPLESRLESLSAADEAWKYRGDGFRSAREEDVRRTLARLGQRLQSLQETVMLSEARWRAKGDGMRQAQVVQEGTRINTTEKVGGLMERLELLQQEEDSWVRRDNWVRFDRSKFDRDVRTERAAQELAQQSKDESLLRKEEDKQRVLQQKAEEEAKQRRKELEEQKEAERRDAVKEKMKKVSIVDQGFDPHKERKQKVSQKEEEERLAKEAKEKLELEKRLEAERESSKKKQVEDAKQQASRFLSKLKQQP